MKFIQLTPFKCLVSLLNRVGLPVFVYKQPSKAGGPFMSVYLKLMFSEVSFLKLNYLHNFKLILVNLVNLNRCINSNGTKFSVWLVV